MVETKTIVAGGFTTRYIEAGDPGNPTVVLIHDGAFGTTAELCWGEVADLLSDRYHVLAPEMLGWGGTDKVVFFDRAPYPPRIAHIAAWLRAVGVAEDAFFAGTSFGGSLVMRALIDPSSPWPIKKAVSIGGAGGLFRYPDGVVALSEYDPSLESARRLTLLVVDEYAGLDEHVAKRHENSLIPGHWESLSAPRLKNPATARPPFDDPFPTALANVKQPLLLVEGARDQLLEPGWAAKLAELAPAGRSLVLDAQHEPNLDQPKLCAQTLADFFDEGLS